VEKKHSFSYIPDIAEALHILGTSDKSWGQYGMCLLHPQMTLEEIIALINHLVHKHLKPQVMNEFMTAILRLFIPALAK